MILDRLKQRRKMDEELYDETIRQAISEEERIKSLQPVWGWTEDRLIEPSEEAFSFDENAGHALTNVLSRAKCTKAAPALFCDQAACAIAEYCGCDIEGEDPTVEDYLAAFKQLHFLEISKTYLTLFPRAFVIDLGCGLSTLRQQLDNKKLKWINVDTESCLELRSALGLDRKERSKNIGANPFGYEWIREVQYKQDRGCIIIVEDPMVDRSAHDVKHFLATMKAYFPKALIMFGCQAYKTAGESDNFRLYTINAEDVFHSWFDDAAVRVYSTVVPPKEELSLCCKPKSVKRALKRAFKRGSQILVDIRF